MELTGEPDGPPTRVGVSLIDSMSGLTGIGRPAGLPAARQDDGAGLRRRYLPVRRRHAPAHLSRRLVPQRRRRLAARAAQRASVAGAGADLPDGGRLDLHHVHDPEVLAVARARRWAATTCSSDPRFPDPNTRGEQPRRADRGARSDLPHAHDRGVAGDVQRRCCRPRRSIASTRRSIAASPARPAWSRAVPHPAKGEPARDRQSPPHRRRAAGAGRLLAARRRQRLSAGQAQHEARRHQGRRPLLVPAGAVSHHGAGRSRRRGDQGRAAGRGRSRPPHPAARRAHLGVLPQHGPRQEERRARPQERAGPRRSLPPVHAKPT